MVFVKEVLESKGYQVWSIASDATIKEALQLLSEKDVGALPVLDGEKLVGVFSERDYTRRMAQMDTCSLDDAVAEIMSKEIYCVDPSTRLSECMDLMTEKRTRN
jgi:CBS domain-containing protein